MVPLHQMEKLKKRPVKKAFVSSVSNPALWIVQERRFWDILIYANINLKNEEEDPMKKLARIIVRIFPNDYLPS